MRDRRARVAVVAGLEPSQGRRRPLPATHFMRIVRGAMLKGASLGGIFAELAARLGIRLIVSTLAISRYKVTLD